MMDERHRSLKRWERARQYATLEKDPVLAGPAALCRIKSAATDTESWIPVFIVEIFSKDLACVKACEEPSPAGVPGPYWLVRGGIRWEDYLLRIVSHYRSGMAVPVPFRPIRKLGGELVSRLEAIPGASLPEVFGKMRDSGLLPALRTLSQANCPPTMPWDQMRALFQDFKG